ncbi:unnamed protein product [Polarella glacialis]|uniref:glucan 1,3-beta-glucosidase n=2 Tax=Polarella glacialis TaxID=89957 RepID=A0A813JUP6_POLGL|nr:unnamed protein product [Polarella glacialis]
MDVAGDLDVRELYFLARWMKEPGVVQLRHAICGQGSNSPTIIIKRLGKQLGPGTDDLSYSNSVLRDMQEGRSVQRTPPQAAQQLLAVACFLRRMHLDGYTHNDLHSGNILRSGDSESAPLVVIDLGSACEAGSWKSTLGNACGAGWSITRDWRALALHFLSLIDGKLRDLWELIGTSEDLPLRNTAWAVPHSVQVAARAANGSVSQKWTVNRATGQIVSRKNGKALTICADDNCSVTVESLSSDPNQQWIIEGGSIRGPASLCLDICEGIEGSAVIAHAVNEGDNQQWRYDEASGEVVNPMSRKVLDMSGEVRLPEDVEELLGCFAKREERNVFAELLEALLKDRADPNEICALFGLLASQACAEQGRIPSFTPRMELPAHRSFSRANAPWRGVNLGGWLLLEPGPSTGLFENFLRRNGTMAKCEWDLMEILEKKNAFAELRQHRETHITKQDFIQIKEMGLNSVRLPFGYWVVMGCRHGEPYQGPAMEYIDRALDWADEVGLQVVLDLHGCPGGESPDAPCGRRLRPKSKWHWTQWRVAESLQALEKLALRYRDRACVTGIQVCNEPSTEIPLEKLCEYYDLAMTTVRRAGMSEDHVAVLLPAFQRDLREVATAFSARSGGRHRNFCFDMHYYHCFDWYNDLTMGSHLGHIEEHRKELELFPCCIGEWSMALGRRASKCRCLPAKEIRAMFAKAQRTTYDSASHGWFFWNWKDGNGGDWDYRQACLTDRESLIGAAEIPCHHTDCDELAVRQGEMIQSPLPDPLTPYEVKLAVHALHDSSAASLALGEVLRVKQSIEDDDVVLRAKLGLLTPIKKRRRSRSTRRSSTPLCFRRPRLGKVEC